MRERVNTSVQITVKAAKARGLRGSLRQESVSALTLDDMRDASSNGVETGRGIGRRSKRRFLRLMKDAVHPGKDKEPFLSCGDREIRLQKFPERILSCQKEVFLPRLPLLRK
jgi:hypothetical protein